MKTDIFKSLWLDYQSLAPDSEKIHKLIEGRGETIINDHIAFRTFNFKGINLHDVAKVFLKMGYQTKGALSFKEKKLKAEYYIHPDSNLPKVFVSHLLVEEFSAEFQTICHKLSKQTQNHLGQKTLDLPCTPWQAISYAEYERLGTESEYGAWLAAFGIRANHFTVSVNRLSTFKNIEELNEFLKNNGFRLNHFGGEIKGSKEQFLKQSSIMASNVPCMFSDVNHNIPGCYYEFAERFAVNAKGDLFDGFIEGSADKIFESTDRK